MKKILYIFYFLVPALCLFFSCATVDLYEKNVSIPKHEWQGSYKPSFDFTITDTVSSYEIFLVFRHTEKYSYNNIYVNLFIKGPGQDSVIKVQRDLLLATNDKGWLASGMDDIYEHRIQLTDRQTLKAGTYSFTIEQIMREDPLKNVLNVGLRVEKEK